VMRVFAAALVGALLSPAVPAAHRLDEYLQAARVSLERDRLTLDVDLTPGANVASAFVSLLDRDGDTAISPAEAEAYGRRVLSELVIELDQHPVAVTLTRIEAPSIGEMRDGVGTIQLRAVGVIDPVAAGRHDVYFRNNHEPAPSDYLVNALIPQDGDVSVVAQDRDRRQQGIRIEYSVSRHRLAPWLWLAVAAAAISALIAIRFLGTQTRETTNG
jgi:nickel/cobalt transporter (NicO) family protein